MRALGERLRAQRGERVVLGAAAGIQRARRVQYIAPRGGVLACLVCRAAVARGRPGSGAALLLLGFWALAAARSARGFEGGGRASCLCTLLAERLYCGHWLCTSVRGCVLTAMERQRRTRRSARERRLRVTVRSAPLRWATPRSTALPSAHSAAPCATGWVAAEPAGHVAYVRLRSLKLESLLCACARAGRRTTCNSC